MKMFENKNYTNAQIMMFIAQSFEHQSHIKSIQEIDGKGIIVKWRSTTFIVYKNLSVYEYDDGAEIGSDISIMIRRAIMRPAVEFELGLTNETAIKR